MFVGIALEMGTFIYEVPRNLKKKVVIGSLVKVPLQNREADGWIVEIINELPPHMKSAHIKEVLGISYPNPLISDELIELGKRMASYYQSSLGVALNLMVPGIGKVRGAEEERSREREQKSRLSDKRKLPSVISHSLQEREFKSILLYGGMRRDIYLQAIEGTLMQGKDVILLVPEIELTAPIFSLLQKEFGELVALFHSRLKKDERWIEWLRIKEGIVRIVVGTQSAVFAPVQRLGLIIIDEEQEESYKSMQSPRYSAGVVGEMRAKINKCVYIAGSGTPSIEAFHRTETGKSTLVRLVGASRGTSQQGKMEKKVWVVDMRREFDPIFSELLKRKLKTYIEKGERVILFLNKKGWASFIVCGDCGYLPKCPNCSIPLTYHREEISASSGLKCHYCGYREKAPGYCPQCKGSNLLRKGIGTVRVERAFSRLFPNARMFRLDLDTVSRKYVSHIFKSFAEGKIQVLLGTQLVAKSLEFPDVPTNPRLNRCPDSQYSTPVLMSTPIGLVGIISADTGLNLPDFRGPERTFSLLTRLVNKGKEAIVQTYNPEHRVLQSLLLHNYFGFYRSEKSARKECQYPPYSHLVRILVEGKNKDVVSRHISSLQTKLKEKNLNFLGPSACPIERKKGKFRFHFLLKVKDPYELSLSSIVSKDVIIDVDPVELI